MRLQFKNQNIKNMISKELLPKNLIIKTISVFLVLFYSSSTFAQQDKDVLMMVGQIPVTVEEFRYIYEKNNGKEANYSKESVAEYLDLYTKFKLKVNEARTQKIDTIQSLMEELNGYNKQLSTSYLMDKGVMDYLMKQLKARQKMDRRIAHIYIPIPNIATDEIKRAAKAKIDDAYTKLKSGMSFDQVAKLVSEDKNTNQTGGDLGFYTAMMPNGFYEFENAMYDTPIGQYSKPLLSNIGWHIIKPTEERTARGEIQVAHLLVRHVEGSNDPVSKINDMYRKLQNGSNWDEIVSLFSEDNASKNNGGQLPKFGINTYERTFEEGAFGLVNEGDYTKPLRTEGGWHIIKLIEKSNEADDADYKKKYEAKIKADERYQIAKVSLLANIRQAANFKIDTIALRKFTNTLDDEFFTYKWKPSDLGALGNDQLISFGVSQKNTVEEFAYFADKNARIRLRFDKSINTIKQPVDALLDAFIEDKTIEFEQANMVLKYPEFKALLREYEEGILLFEVTKNEVWDKASQDSIGLEAFYKANDTKYMSEEKALVRNITILSGDLKLAQKILKDAIKNSADNLAKKYNKKAKVIEVVNSELTKSEIASQGLEWKINSINAMEKAPTANQYQFSRLEGFIAPKPKALKDARGYVVADYQDYLEKTWIEALKAKYPVELNSDVLTSLYR